MKTSQLDYCGDPSVKVASLKQPWPWSFWSWLNNSPSRLKSHRVFQVPGRSDGALFSCLVGGAGRGATHYEAVREEVWATKSAGVDVRYRRQRARNGFGDSYLRRAWTGSRFATKAACMNSSPRRNCMAHDGRLEWKNSHVERMHREKGEMRLRQISIGMAQ